MNPAVEVEGRRLALTNLGKPMYPEAGWTKGHVVDYYAAMAPAILPHLAGRPVTLRRYPDGVDGEAFFEKECPSHRPAWIRTTPVPRRSKPGPTRHCVLESAAALVWVANLAALELHAPLGREPDVDRPTAVVFDLDPGDGADVLDCCRVALDVREALSALGLVATPKLSGLKGLQVYVPLNTSATFPATKAFAHGVATLLERGDPDRVTTSMSRARRRGRVFVDWSQNSPRKTTVAVYSLRGAPRPTASAPLEWSEVRSAKRPGDLKASAGAVRRRFEKDGDLFSEVLTREQELPTWP